MGLQASTGRQAFRLTMARAALVALLPVLTLTAAVSPPLALLWVPLLVLGAVAIAHPALARRFLMIGAGAVAVLVLLVVPAVRPSAAVVCVAVIILAGAVFSHAAVAVRALAAGSLLAVVALVAVVPGYGAAVALGGGAFAVACSVRGSPRSLGRPAPMAIAWIALGCFALGLALSQWPVTVLLLFTVATVIFLGWRAPAWALWAGVLLIGFEGSIKLLLGLEHTPIPGGRRAVGAAAIDVALFAAVGAVLIADRWRTPKALWSRAARPERVAMGLLAGWLALSVIQIAQGGDLWRGLSGFRLFQAYTVVTVAAAIVFARPSVRERAIQAALVVGLLVSAYAAFRVLVGPSDAEATFATSVNTTVGYGSALRAIGSFSSAVGLISFLSPTTAFALVIGFFMPRVRRLAWIVGALGLVGLIGSYGRASLVGLALGVGCALILLLVGADISVRRKLTAVFLAAGLLVGTYGGVLIASRASPQLAKRTEGILNPTGDKSAQLRFGTWDRTLHAAVNEPLGGGVGTVGSASAPDRRHFVTTDDSFLKVLREQGFLGLALFLGGVLAAVVLLGRRLRRATGDSRALGLAALAGFVTFLGISVSGEYVEQPGKAVAWALLGIALAQALGPVETRNGNEES
jgi:hypothetical protein